MDFIFGVATGTVLTVIVMAMMNIAAQDAIEFETLYSDCEDCQVSNIFICKHGGECTVGNPHLCGNAVIKP